MNILSKVLDELKFRIPGEVLRVAFQDKGPNWRQAPISLDNQMLNKVIKPRVLVDANLVGGQAILVSLAGLTPKWLDTFSVVYEIPAEFVMHRSIISVLSIGYLPYTNVVGSQGIGMGSTTLQGMSDLTAVTQRVADSYSNIPIVSNATVELVGYNTVLIRDQVRVTNAYQLRCIIGNEDNLNNINPRSYLQFSKLCELAIKSYIYNTLIIAMDQAYLSGGQELGAMKTYVENLAESEQMYQDYIREVWQGVAFMNDQMSHTRFLKLMTNPSI